ncbi:hypothetical protein [Sphingomonas sp. Leaf257]|jgi:hypothetical protein|uniref:hypothetical protein n=1 Tax=Sphingomonas sp. Leaf257 TaxID=1736309 RepID=UPI000700AF90|nr:hypothetical protein [Sphingomonas sp. Leaf257]KQO58868.1 hypothetical protein ASF14_02870 [Sphingomonas sp. Leaf257]
MTDPLGRVTLADCPPGPFLFDGILGFKTEYRAMVQASSPCHCSPVDPRFATSRWPDAYCIATGEAFWGGTTRHRDRAALLVLPIVLSEDVVRSARAGVMLYRGPGTICPTCFGASWLVGRRSAQCGGCGTALDLATPQAAQVHG